MLNQLYLKRPFRCLSCIIILYLASSIISPCSFAAKVKYVVSDIPEELLKNSKAVVRSYESLFEIKSPSSAKLSVILAITVLDDNGISSSVFQQAYGDFYKLRFSGATIYSEDGKIEKKYSLHDLERMGIPTGGTSFDETKIAYLDPDYRNVPFTIEYEYNVVLKGLLNFPSWSPVLDYNVSVEKASLLVQTPEDYDFRYKQLNFDCEVEINRTTEAKTYYWEVENLKSIRNEVLSPPSLSSLPLLLTAPSEFEIDGYHGSAVSWNDFGKFICELNKDRQELPDETKQLITNMISGIDDPVEKARKIYEYFQNKTRYVSVQLGIGGWQPFDAEYVDENSYGDCKALSNYMVTLLAIAGIESHYTLVNAGSRARLMTRDFSSNQFNHAIVCMPNNGDTIWLECTSQDIPFGFLGTFTDDRDVLIIKEDGGVIGRTTSYSTGDNIQLTKAEIVLEAEGNGDASVRIASRGKFYSDYYRLINMDVMDRRKMVIARTHIPNFILTDYSMKNIKQIFPVFEEKMKFKVKDAYTMTGDRLLMTPNLLQKWDEIPYSLEARESNIYIPRTFTIVDTITYHLPDGFIMQGDYSINQFESEFGSYSSTLRPSGAKFIYTRKLTINKGNYNPASYADLISFNEKVNKADNSRIMVRKSN